MVTMNRIQLISMWCGIAVIVYVGLAIVCNFDFGNMKDEQKE